MTAEVSPVAAAWSIRDAKRSRSALRARTSCWVRSDAVNSSSGTAKAATARTANSSRAAWTRVRTRRLLRPREPEGSGSSGVPEVPEVPWVSEAVAEAADRGEQLGAAQFGAHLGEVDVQGAGHGVVGVAPHLVQELLAADRGARPPGQHGEDVELLGGQLDLGPADPDPAGVEVHLDVTGADRPYDGFGNASGRAPPGDGVDTGEQLGETYRLDEVVVGPEPQPAHHRALVAARGEHHHRHVAHRPQGAQHVQAVGVGQAQVEKQQVGASVVGQYVPAVPDASGDVAVVVQDLDERRGHAVVVLGQQYLHPAHLLSAAPGHPRPPNVDHPAVRPPEC